MASRRGIADYELLEEIGSGSTGVMYRAASPSRLGLEAEFVALKVLDSYASDDEFRRFANEIRLFAAVKSPHLVRVHDAGQQDGTLYYAMEFMPRGSLADGTSEGQLADSEVVHAVAHAARGAHSLHEVGVAHRDIKPSNILIGDNGSVLSDLGLAQILAPGSIVTGTGPIGSIEYMAPNTVRGEKASRSSDIWELGATLHKAVTGKSVYGDIPTDSVLAALRHVLHTSPTISDELSPALAACIERAMAPEPEDRYPTAEEFARDLEEES